jgi:hypothetical protein
MLIQNFSQKCEGKREVKERKMKLEKNATCMED